MRKNLSENLEDIVANTTTQRNRKADVQSGDTQGLSQSELVSNQSVQELAAEGQAFEAEAVSGLEEANSSEVREVTTKQVPEDDVPLEYRNQE